MKGVILLGREGRRPCMLWKYPRRWGSGFPRKKGEPWLLRTYSLSALNTCPSGGNLALGRAAQSPSTLGPQISTMFKQLCGRNMCPHLNVPDAARARARGARDGGRGRPSRRIPRDD